MATNKIFLCSRLLGWLRWQRIVLRMMRLYLQDEHVEELNTNDDPDLVIIQVYITNAFRAYALADHYRKKGVLCLPGRYYM